MALSTTPTSSYRHDSDSDSALQPGASFTACGLTIEAAQMFLNSATSTADIKKFHTDNGLPMILKVIAIKTTQAGHRWLVANTSNTD